MPKEFRVEADVTLEQMMKLSAEGWELEVAQWWYARQEEDEKVGWARSKAGPLLRTLWSRVKEERGPKESL